MADAPGNTARLRPFGVARTIALFFGAGCAPWAPGTAGTLAAVPLAWLLSALGDGVYVAVLVAVVAVGAWASRRASTELGSHDHPGIVIDEVAGYLVTMAFIPVSATTAALGFALFRLFDVVKPWPIRWVDRNVSGGLGIMADDLLAGVYANLCLMGLAFIAARAP